MAHSSDRRFVIRSCNDDPPASQERRKIYEALLDGDAEKHQQTRVIDGSGEDALYPKEYFIPVGLPGGGETGAGQRRIVRMLAPRAARAWARRIEACLAGVRDEDDAPERMGRWPNRP